MRALLPLIGALCVLEANIFVSAGKRRVTREPDVLSPIDCLLSPWSDWGPCSPCTKARYRSRSVLKYGQFGGKPCLERLGDSMPCVPASPCPEEEMEGQADCGKDFRCENGRCIKNRLKCNTEDDCGDFSDEDDCEGSLRPPCRDHIIDVSEVGRTAGHGINILGMQPKSSPFYNEFYNGMCERVRDGNTGIYYRKPWNVAVLGYETKGDRRMTTKLYQDQVTAVKVMYSKREMTRDTTLSLKFHPTEVSENGSVSFHFSRDSHFSANESIHNFLKMSKGKQQVFLHVKGSIEMGHFQMRSRDVRLTDTFLEDVKYLPSAYDKGEYFKFLEMHGTHYARKGTVGGVYELLYVLDTQSMSSQGVSIEDVKSCLGYNMNYGLTVDAIQINSGDKKRECINKNIINADNLTNTAIIQNVISSVHGGKSTVLSRLHEMLSRAGKIVDVEDYVQWAATLPDTPAVITYEPFPISTLIPLTIRDYSVKKQNLDRAVEDYVAEYNVCKCQPCQNGGTVILVNGRCECGCSPYFKGEACQTPTPGFTPAQTATEGRWSCWSSWSSCDRGERVRTRQCNNPAPSNGGRDCLGTSSEPDYCGDIK
ncbi:complement component C9 [Hemicordylus capensis]|uniref:complement component C9 n=1 Tax=Hemicordylus capensis TaxID=884348 RepID=UPI00230400E8|nr:complement component C9 [Hemicordylus capensis]XP_053143750.1 complement component C9 [Hemicordylus capensis]